MTDVYADAERLTLARFPNEGWLHIGEILDDSTNRVFRADIDLSSWADEPSLMLTGFWRHYWADLTFHEMRVRRFALSSFDKPFFSLNGVRHFAVPGAADCDVGQVMLYYPHEKNSPGVVAAKTRGACVVCSGMRAVCLERCVRPCRRP